jgi:hypothetical protein
MRTLSTCLLRIFHPFIPILLVAFFADLLQARPQRGPNPNINRSLSTAPPASQPGITTGNTTSYMNTPQERLHAQLEMSARTPEQLTRRDLSWELEVEYEGQTFFDGCVITHGACYIILEPWAGVALTRSWDFFTEPGESLLLP